MKYTLNILVLVIFCYSCATVVPVSSNYKTNVNKEDVSLNYDNELIDSSSISDKQKITAKKLIYEQHSYSLSLQNLIVKNNNVLAANMKLNNFYSTTGGIIGGLGGITAIGTIFASWTVVVPIATGIWNLIGLGIQNGNIAPQIKNGNELRVKCLSITDKFTKSKELFYILAPRKTGVLFHN